MGFATELFLTALALASGVRLPPQAQSDDAACEIPEGFHVVDIKDSKVGPLKMALREMTRVDIMSKWLTEYGYWEIRHPRELAAMAERTVPPNGTFIDIGANLGWYSLMFARMGYNVIAVEPMGVNRKAMLATLCLNPDIRDRVKLLPVALVAPEDSSQVCVLYSTRNNRGNGILKCSADKASAPCNPDAEDKRGAACELVKVSTLDGLLKEQGVTAVDVVKMDIEGFECNVLRGGQSLFNKFHVKLLQAETKQKHVEECFFKEADTHGYRMGKGVGQDKNRVISSSMARVMASP